MYPVTTGLDSDWTKITMVYMQLANLQVFGYYRKQENMTFLKIISILF